MKLTNHSRIVPLALSLAAGLLSFTSTLQATTHVWSGAGANANFSTAGNWSAGGVPVARELNVILIFAAGAANKSPVQNIAELGIDQIVIQADGYFFTATATNNFFLRGGAAVDIENQTSAGTFFDVTAPLVLNSGEVLIHGTNGSVTISSVISGSGALRIEGPTVELGGSAANTYLGATTLYDGILKLSKLANINAIPGALNIGHPGVGSPFPLDDVILTSSHQITNSAVVSVHRSGRLLLDNNSETIGALEMTGGSVASVFGALTLNGNVHVSAPELDFASIGGNLSLGAGSRIFNVDAGCHLRVSAVIFGGAGIGFTKQGAGSMELYNNASTYSGVTTVEAGQLTASGASVTFGTAAAGTVVSNGASLLLSWANIGVEPLQLNGAAPGTNGSVLTAYGSCSWAGPVTLNGVATNTVHVLTVDMTFSGVLSGAGTLRFLGEIVSGSFTTLILSGPSANTYTGGTLAEFGRMQLNKTAGVNAIPGALLIGYFDHGGLVTYPVVELLASNQIADAAVVSTLPYSLLSLGAFNDSIGGLDMNGGSAETTTGTLTLLGDVTFRNASGGGSSISGKLSLGNQTRTFQCLSNSSGYISAAISGTGTAGINKTGLGALGLAGANTYPGVTTVAQGGIQVYSDLALGSTAAGTVLAFETALILYGVNIGNESLEMNGGPTYAVLGGAGTCSWAGPITLNTLGEHSFYPRLGDLTLSGPISGPGTLRVVVENAKVILTGAVANTYSGGTLVYSGDLVLAKNPGVTAIPGPLDITAAFPANVVLSNDTQIADSAATTMWPGSGFNLNNHSETIGSLAGTGIVATASATLTVGGNNLSTTFNGTISGSGAVTLVKQGSGALTLTGLQTYLGRTDVTGGKLLVNGSVGSHTTVNGNATLGGNGFVGTVGSTNGFVSPGSSPGRLTTKGLALNTSTLNIELNGTTPGVDYDQLQTTGTVTLATSCVLSTTLGFASAGGDQFTIINNDGNDAVIGTFVGLPQGQQFTLNGQKFSISYTGGTGNDVVLTHINTAPSLTSITATPFANEGSSVSINGVINDPDSGDAFAFVVDWADGSALETNNLPVGTFSFHVEHLYADDKPGPQPSDSFMINYTLADTSGSPTFGQLNTVIGNVAPGLPTGAGFAVKSGTPLAATLNFTDPGTDTWTATAHYGDGAGVQAVTVGPGKTLNLNHTFPTNGTYTVNLTVNDDDTGVGTGTVTVYVGLELTILKNSGTNAFVRWPLVFLGFTLESTPVLPGGTNWLSVTNPPGIADGQWQVNVPTTNGNYFFRLRKP